MVECISLSGILYCSDKVVDAKSNLCSRETKQQTKEVSSGSVFGVDGINGIDRRIIELHLKFADLCHGHLLTLTVLLLVRSATQPFY